MEIVDFIQLKLRFTDPIQYNYEVIRPIVLFGQEVTERSTETEIERTVVGDKARKFVMKGMMGLADQRPERSGRKGHDYPEPIARHIIYLKQVYPPIHYQEIVRILKNKFGYKTNHHTVKAFLTRHPVPVQLEFELTKFHEFEDAYQARWTVVRMYYEGWNKKSISEVLKLTRRHIDHLIAAFKKDGFAGLEDKRTRPAAHPHNQLTLPLLEKVADIQQEYPRAGRFRVHGLLEQEQGEDTPSERTIGRAMAINRVLNHAPGPWPLEEVSENKEPVPLPFHPLYRHHYWFVDIRYLVKLDGKWVYSVCVIEGYSRQILAGMASLYQDELAILQLLHAALAEYGAPEGIVSDNAAVFKAHAYEQLLATLRIEKCHIQKRQSWQNLIEAQFKIQLRLADAKFEQATSFVEIQEHHAAFVQIFNTTNHWAHRDCADEARTPVQVLAWTQGRPLDPRQLQRAFRHLQFPRLVKPNGYVSVQRFYLYAEQGLARQRVSIWVYQDRLQIEYEQTPLARYQCQLDRQQKSLQTISHPQLFDTPFDSPQVELFELDDSQWLKVLQRPPFISRSRSAGPLAHQLTLFTPAFIFWFVWLTY